MKLSVFLLALAPPGATGGRAGAAQHHIAVAAEVENGPGVHPDAARDIAACTRVASRFIKTPATRVVVMEHVKNFCATSKRLAKSNFACPHFQEAVEAALSQQPEDTKFNPRSFCEATEGHMLNMRGATRVPHTGSGPLQDFKISQQCEHIVSAAVKPQVNVPTNKVPDLWYALCMNQNCAHFLPSRTKWCDEKVTPTHGVQVCEAVRKFALDEVAVHETGEMDAQQMCTLFGEFVRETGIDVDAYEHVIHEDSVKRVPTSLMASRQGVIDKVGSMAELMGGDVNTTDVDGKPARGLRSGSVAHSGSVFAMSLLLITSFLAADA